MVAILEVMSLFIGPSMPVGLLHPASVCQHCPLHVRVFLSLQLEDLVRICSCAERVYFAAVSQREAPFFRPIIALQFVSVCWLVSVLFVVESPCLCVLMLILINGDAAVIFAGCQQSLQCSSPAGRSQQGSACYEVGISTAEQVATVMHNRLCSALKRYAPLIRCPACTSWACGVVMSATSSNPGLFCCASAEGPLQHSSGLSRSTTMAFSANLQTRAQAPPTSARMATSGKMQMGSAPSTSKPTVRSWLAINRR